MAKTKSSVLDLEPPRVLDIYRVQYSHKGAEATGVQLVAASSPEKAVAAAQAADRFFGELINAGKCLGNVLISE